MNIEIMQPEKTKYPVEFSILIPAYNEAKNILATINETIKVLYGFNKSHEILVVDDGSTDDTAEVLSGYLPEEEKVKLISYFPNKGKGYALKYGTNFLNGEYTLFLDADLDLHPSHLINMFEILKANNADAVIGSKMHKDSVIHVPFYRKVFSFTYYLLIKILFRLSVRDTQTGIKLFRTEVLKNAYRMLL